MEDIELLCPETEVLPDSLEEDTQQQPAAAPQPPTKRYRMEARGIFYTWPQCDTPKESVMHALVQEFTKREIEFILVCREWHQDGCPHLHAMTVCKKVRNCSKPTWADKFAGKHGNYVAVRSIKASVEYIQKKGDWIVYPEGYDFEKRWASGTDSGRKRKVTDEIATKIATGTSYKQLLLTEEHRGFFMLNSRKIQEYEAELKRARVAESVQASLVQWRYVDKTPSMSFAEGAIVDWMNKNLGGIQRSLGEPQLYLHGPTGIGKTFLISKLRTFFRVYDVCMNEDWMDDYSDDDYDLVVMEEFKGQKQITWMNQFLDGQPCPIRRRGKSAYLKTKNLPVIILSNWSLERAYKNSSEEKLAPLLRRLFVVDTTLDHSTERPINIFG